MHEPHLVEVVLQRAGERADDVEAPVLPQLHVEDLDLQHVTRLRALDRDRAGQDVRAARKALGAGVHLGKLRRNVEAGFGNELGAPLSVSMVTRSPLSIVSSGLRVASKNPQ